MCVMYNFIFFLVFLGGLYFVWFLMCVGCFFWGRIVYIVFGILSIWWGV